MSFLRKRKTPERTLSLYYASDVHGSDLCWRKFLGAAKFYGVETLVMGGDLTGKAIVPIAVNDNFFSATFLGEERSGDTQEKLDELIDAIRYNGMYPWLAPADEIERYREDAAAREQLFDSVLLDELKRWVDLADERLSAQDVPAYVIAGNDDPWECDSVLASGSWITFSDDRVVRMGEHEMLSLSYANPTPWASPRELDEDDLYRRIHVLAEQLEDPHRAIFNLHVPPYDTGIDAAVEINPDLTPVYVAGQPNVIPVGSRAVRQVIEEYQPVVSLHGHIHESRGEARIGRTLALNSGSEYNTGRIHGVLVTLGGDEVIGHQFVVG